LPGAVPLLVRAVNGVGELIFAIAGFAKKEDRHLSGAVKLSSLQQWPEGRAGLGDAFASWRQGWLWPQATPGLRCVDMNQSAAAILKPVNLFCPDPVRQGFRRTVANSVCIQTG